MLRGQPVEEVVHLLREGPDAALPQEVDIPTVPGPPLLGQLPEVVQGLGARPQKRSSALLASSVYPGLGGRNTEPVGGIGGI